SLRERGRSRRRHAMVELGAQVGGALRIGSKPKRTTPFESGFVLAAGAPVGVSEMVDDLGVRRRQLGAPFRLLDRVVILTELEMRPAEAVDDVALVRACSDGPADQIHPLLHLLAAIDPAIAQEVLQLRPVRLDSKGGSEIGFSLLPTPGLVAGRRAGIEHAPVLAAG